jgi:hypothetical protein
VVILGFCAFLGFYLAERGKQRAILETLKKNTAIVEGIRSSHDKELHISKAQFDTEFTIYREVWTKLVALRNAALALRPDFEWTNPNETEEEAKRRKIGDFRKAITEVIGPIENNKPFCSPDIYKALDDFTKLAYKEFSQYRLGSPKDFNAYWENADNNQKAILASTDTICEAIRTRVSAAFGKQ